MLVLICVITGCLSQAQRQSASVLYLTTCPSGLAVISCSISIASTIKDDATASASRLCVEHDPYPAEPAAVLRCRPCRRQSLQQRRRHQLRASAACRPRLTRVSWNFQVGEGVVPAVAQEALRARAVLLS